MPELPWVKWYPQDWLSDPCLSRCSPATRGIYKDILDATYLSNKPSISGTYQELSRICRCSESEMKTAVNEITEHAVAGVVMQNSCITIECRRIAREFEIRHLRSKAASSRWSKHDAKVLQGDDANTYARSASVSASVSVPEGDCKGETRHSGFPVSAEAAMVHAEFICCPREFARRIWTKAEGRGGCDAKDVPIRSFRHYLQTEWTYEQARIHKSKPDRKGPNI